MDKITIIEGRKKDMDGELQTMVLDGHIEKNEIFKIMSDNGFFLNSTSFVSITHSYKPLMKIQGRVSKVFFNKSS